MKREKREREEPCYICGHYHDYENGEPCTVCGHRLVRLEEKGPQASAFPSELLPGFLYLGSYDNASRSELLKALGITHILNLVPTCPVLYKNSFTYHTAKSVPADFQESFDFIESARTSETKVLVHCMSGNSRSPAVAIGYLIYLRKWRLYESFKWVKEIRPSINITQEEGQRLQELEVRLLGSSSMPAVQASPAASSSGDLGSSITHGAFSWGNPAASPPQQAAPQSWQPPLPQFQASSAPVAAFSFFGQASAPMATGFVFGAASPPQQLPPADSAMVD